MCAQILLFSLTDIAPFSGILHVAHACLQVLFFRVFLRISYVCPAHLKFSMTIERMTLMLDWAKESADWIIGQDFYFDTVGLLSYSLVSCATLLYHAQIRRGDAVALQKLQNLRDFFKRASSTEDGKDDSVRAKSGAVISLLCDAAMGAFPSERYSGALNPTAGVSNRKTAEAVKGLKFRADPTRPGGGVYVADTSDSVVHDLPRGTVVLKEQQAPTGMPVFTQSPTTGTWQMVSGSADATQVPTDDPSLGHGAKLVTMFPIGTGLANFADAQQALQQLPQQQPHLQQLQHAQSQPQASSSSQAPDGTFAPQRPDQPGHMPFANVNPHLNENDFNPAANFVFESSAELAPNLQRPGVDPLLLDGLPQHLDFDAWSSWFARLQPAEAK